MASRADLLELFFFIGIGLVVVAVTSFVMYFTLSAKVGNHAMGCGGCGYAAKGASTFECPECGADLREVGIQRGRQSKMPFLVALTTGLALGTAVIVVGAWLCL